MKSESLLTELSGIGNFVGPAARTASGAHRRAAFLLLPWMLWLGLFVLLSVCTPVHAAQQLQVAPMFLFDEGYFDPPTPWEPTLSQAWSDVQAAKNGCITYPTYSICYTVQNLHPDTTGGLAILYNNTVYYWNQFDLQTCQTPSGGSTTCNTASDWNTIQTYPTCPPGFGASDHAGTDSNPRHDTVMCLGTLPPSKPAPPARCKNCVGDPIFASTGLAVEPETDYRGASGLSYVRTYRSDFGAWFSIANAGFVDYSQTNATTSNGCYQSYWVNPNTSANVAYCFPYISSATNAYQLNESDGNYVQFTGPNSDVTQSADINDRVSQVVVGGSTEWQVRREDDSTEYYSTAGALIQRVERGGRTFNFAYSGPGLLSSEQDAFGHTLSWQYNAQGQISQMTDPAGRVYQYSYDSAGHLTGVTYPDGSTKTYSYNESADTGGASLPSALTGVTDESGGRYATYKYQSMSCCGGIAAAFAVSSQAAGGMNSYSISYDGAAYYGSSITSAVVTDPLGTQRTYHFTSELSYNVDTSQVQPAASGSGTVTQSETYDANGNPSSITDFNGNTTNRLLKKAEF